LHVHLANPGHHLTFGQIAIAHHRPTVPYIFQAFIGGQKGLEFGLHRLRNEFASPIAQQAGERINCFWCWHDDHVILAHGVSFQLIMRCTQTLISAGCAA
jgi:hypothetical protein